MKLIDYGYWTYVWHLIKYKETTPEGITGAFLDEYLPGHNTAEQVLKHYRDPYKIEHWLHGNKIKHISTS